MSEQKQEKDESERAEINDILDRFQQKWGMNNAQIAKELGVTDVSLSYAKNGKRSGKNILAKLRKLADSYNLSEPELEHEEQRLRNQRELQLAQQLTAKIHPVLVKNAYAYLGFDSDSPIFSFLGDEGVVELALQKHAHNQQWLKFLFAPRPKVPQLPAPQPQRALPPPRNFMTITEESIVESVPSQAVRFCYGCLTNIRGMVYEVPSKNPLYGHEYDYYCEQCGQQK